MAIIDSQVHVYEGEHPETALAQCPTGPTRSR